MSTKSKRDLDDIAKEIVDVQKETDVLREVIMRTSRKVANEERDLIQDEEKSILDQIRESM